MSASNGFLHITRGRGKQAWGLARSLFIVALLVGLVMWLTRPGSLHVTSITLATLLDSDFNPVQKTDSFGRNDTFYVSVKLQGYRAGTPVIARWSYGTSVIAETPLTFSRSGNITAGFSLSNNRPPWAAGVYHVDIMSDGTVLGSVTFEVR